MSSLSPEEALRQALQTFPPVFRTPFGAVSYPDEEGWGAYFHLENWADGKSALSHGRYRMEGFEGICDEADEEWELPTQVLSPTFRRLERFPGVVDSWTWAGRTMVDFRGRRWIPSLSGPHIPKISATDLEKELLPSIRQDPNHNYYWSDDWSPEFYRLQATRGFIAVARDRGDRCFLLPELQHSYAVLDWENLKMDRQTTLLLKSSGVREDKVRLYLNSDPRRILDALEAYWSDRSWILPPYRKILEHLADFPQGNFRVWGAELLVESQDGPLELAAGELGYAVGRVYTSLSGFFRRDRKEWSGFGKLQLVLLARELESRGYHFHNLGHPYMDYKIRLGARILPRTDFLNKWEASSGLPHPDS